MRHLVFHILTLACLGLNAQNADSTKYMFVYNDSTFILRDWSAEVYHAIYLETNQNSQVFQQVMDFNFSGYDRDNYLSTYEYFEKKHPNSYNKRNQTDLPINWLPVYIYQDSLYLYAPCDFGNVGRKNITDSAFVHWYMDGPTPFPILSAAKVSETKYKLIIQDILNELQTNITLTVKILDPITKLSYFEFSNKLDLPVYCLYIPLENANHLNMIVNHCKSQKESEFEFEEIDIDKITNNYRQHQPSK